MLRIAAHRYVSGEGPYDAAALKFLLSRGLTTVVVSSLAVRGQDWPAAEMLLRRDLFKLVYDNERFCVYARESVEATATPPANVSEVDA